MNKARGQNDAIIFQGFFEELRHIVLLAVAKMCPIKLADATDAAQRNCLSYI